MTDTPPSVVILAGPNGAGKTTAAPFVLRDALGVDEFVNADDIARGLSGFAPERSAVAAGRIMLARMGELAGVRATFAFETTLATRSYAPWLARLRRAGYRVTLLFLFLPSPELAIERVRGRVAEGGHDVPEAVVRRRYERGLRNLWNLYLPLADDWSVYDNAGSRPDLIAVGRGTAVERVVLQAQWRRFREDYADD
ncbi:MAG: AAA family ATPase [Phycisphaeraceae bacterium]|nr:AAA family ATPase [Phycisphaeraceae bacterium]